MKKYFDFTLSGKKMLIAWLLIFIPMIVLNLIQTLDLNEMTRYGWPIILGFFFGLLIPILAGSFYISTLIIKSVRFNHTQIEFDGKLATYFGKVILGYLLSVITIGIYMGAYIKNVTKYMIDSSSLNGSRFEFKGRAGKLLLIIILSCIIPMVLLTIVMTNSLLEGNPDPSLLAITNALSVIIMIPYIYLIYNWMVDVKFKEYHIRWETSFINSCGKILLEILLILITLGIYMPLGYLKLYKYFIERTVAESRDKTLHFGYELEDKDDFIYIWKQLLLVMITLGIYYPWAIANVGKRVLGKTYLEDNSIEFDSEYITSIE